MNIYGASGHSKVIIEIINSVSGKIDTIIDDDVSIKSILKYPVEHSYKALDLNIGTILAIGNNGIRKKIADRYLGLIEDAVIHISAVVSTSAVIGNGTVIMANASVNSEALVGKHCILNTGSVVEHDCKIEDFVHISPNASIAGNVSIGEGSHIGIGACIIPGISIGKWATIGAGAVIIKDIPDYAVVVGNPGKQVNLDKI